MAVQKKYWMWYWNEVTMLSRTLKINIRTIESLICMGTWIVAIRIANRAKNQWQNQFRKGMEIVFGYAKIVRRKMMNIILRRCSATFVTVRKWKKNLEVVVGKGGGVNLKQDDDWGRDMRC